MSANDFVVSFLERVIPAKIREKVLSEWDLSKDDFLKCVKLTDEEEFLKRVEMAAEKGAASALLNNHKEDNKVVKVEKKKKKKKASDAPKGPLNGYIIFSNDNRSRVKDENKELKTTEISSLLGEMWREMKKNDTEEYRRYMDLAKDSKDRYALEMKSYVPDVSEEKEEKKKVKREKSSWQYFGDVMRPKLKEEGYKGRDIMSELSKRWKALSDKQKSKFKKIDVVQSESEAEDNEGEDVYDSDEELLV